MNWDHELTEGQRIAAMHVGTHARLLAGPGTGKTLVLTRRVLYLTQELDISPNDILVLTFTRAAANELRQRIYTELGEDSLGITISTLHSFALKTILQEGAAMRLPQPIRIADDWEERNIIEEDLKSTLRLDRIKDAQTLLERLSADWEQLTADQVGYRFPNPEFIGAWQEHREIFGYTLRAELVYQLRHALEEGNVQLGRRHGYIFIDEYQDLNPCDLSVIKKITENRAELYVAGDDDQSIYGFRFADPEGIRRFDRDYPNATSLTLEECKRCGPQILDVANYVARQDHRRYDKIIRSVPETPASEVRILNFPNQFDEARKIAKICEWLNKSREINLANILILLRGDHNGIFSALIREELERVNLAVGTVTNLHKCLDENEGRNFLSLLRLVVDIHDHLAWRTLLQIRTNNIGDVTLKVIYEAARLHNQGFSSYLSDISNDPSLVPQFGPRIAVEIAAIQQLLSALNQILQQSDGLFDGVINAAEHFVGDPEIKREILTLFEQVCATTAPTNLGEVLRAINLSLENKEQEQEAEAINIMSMHQAKGLTADAVIIVGAEDEYIPGRAQGVSIDDERRLLYVSLSRARQFLYITHCQQRINQQAHTGRNPGNLYRILTRFLRDGPIRSENGILYADGLHAIPAQ